MGYIAAESLHGTLQLYSFVFAYDQSSVDCAIILMTLLYRELHKLNQLEKWNEKKKPTKKKKEKKKKPEEHNLRWC